MSRNTNTRSTVLVTVIINAIVTIVILALVGVLPAGTTIGQRTGPGQVSQTDMVPRRPARTSDGGQVVDVVATANPAVVSIVVTKDIPIIEEYFEDYNPFGDFFGGFGGFGGFQIPRYRENGTEEREVGGGSGFIVSADGLVVTNRHVVDDVDASYSLLTNDGQQYDVEVIARDALLDVAILQISDSSVTHPYLDFADSAELQLGQTVIAIGNALAEFRNSVSVGVVSGLSRSIVAGNGFGQGELLDEVIQTDAAINPGNSGGPLLNLAGEVVGVNVAVAAGSENIGFSLPANVVKNVVDSVKEHGEIVRPYIGIRYIPVTPSMQERNSLDVDYGALIQRGENREDLAVIPGSPADKAGLYENDIILEVDGKKLDEDVSLGSIIRKKQVGDVLDLLVLHRGEEKTVQIILEQAPNDF